MENTLNCNIESKSNENIPTEQKKLLNQVLDSEIDGDIMTIGDEEVNLRNLLKKNTDKNNELELTKLSKDSESLTMNEGDSQELLSKDKLLLKLQSIINAGDNGSKLKTKIHYEIHNRKTNTFIKHRVKK